MCHCAAREVGNAVPAVTGTVAQKIGDKRTVDSAVSPPSFWSARPRFSACCNVGEISASGVDPNQTVPITVTG